MDRVRGAFVKKSNEKKKVTIELDFSHLNEYIQVVIVVVVVILTPKQIMLTRFLFLLNLNFLFFSLSLFLK
jgi:predicted RNase H-related nuclease YkuK (DUF458 family)